jgi:peptidoglycan/xylan/chitin deacetylase (PgdA/CDA1 family)
MKRALLHIAKFIGLFALLRSLTRKQARILCYHAGNIGDERHYNPKLFCAPEHLRARLMWLRAKGFVPASLEQVATDQPGKHAGIRVAMTFDDGWYSSYRDLLPVMAEYGHRPTLYLHTEVYEMGTPVIPVCLHYILWKATARTVALASFSEDMNRAWALDDPVQRRHLHMAAAAWIATHAPSMIVACLERFAAALGIAAAELDLGSRRFSYMSQDELHAATAGGCSIELHGHVHEYVIGNPERNRANIEACRSRIVDAGLPRPQHYCYPSGGFDAKAARVMRAAGVATATTCLPGLVNTGNPDARYFLPRFLDGGDVSMIEFEAEMSGVLQLLRSLVRGQWLSSHASHEAEIEPEFSSI